MKSSINYKDTIFEQANLTHIRVKPTLEMLHKIWKEIQENSKSVYSNLGGVAYGHIVLLLADAQCVLISTNILV